MSQFYKLLGLIGIIQKTEECDRDIHLHFRSSVINITSYFQEHTHFNASSKTSLWEQSVSSCTMDTGGGGGGGVVATKWYISNSFLKEILISIYQILIWRPPGTYCIFSDKYHSSTLSGNSATQTSQQVRDTRINHKEVRNIASIDKAKISRCSSETRYDLCIQ